MNSKILRFVLDFAAYMSLMTVCVTIFLVTLLIDQSKTIQLIDGVSIQFTCTCKK